MIPRLPLLGRIASARKVAARRSAHMAVNGYEDFVR
jgi:hypothetical protein